MGFSFRKLNSRVAVAIVLAAALGAGEDKKSALDKATLEAYVRHLFMWGPQIQVQVGDPKPSEVDGLFEVNVHASAGAASIDQRFYVSKDGRKILQGSSYDVNRNPFRPVIEKLNPEGAPSLGTPGAPVELFLFTDFQCPYCKQEAKVLRDNLLQQFPKEVRLYFKDFPLEAIHPWARTAAIAGRCVFQRDPGLFWEYHDWVFENQASFKPDTLKASILEFARKKQIDLLQFGRCLEAKETQAEVNRSIAEARSLQINQTPTLFVNGRRLASSVSWPQLKAIIDYEINYQKTAGNDGGKECCEVALPAPPAK